MSLHSYFPNQGLGTNPIIYEPKFGTPTDYVRNTRLVDQNRPDMENDVALVVRQHPERGRVTANPANVTARGRAPAKHPSTEPKPILELTTRSGKRCNHLNINPNLIIKAGLTEVLDDGSQKDASEHLWGGIVSNQIQIVDKQNQDHGYIPFPYLYIDQPGKYFLRFVLFEMVEDLQGDFGLVRRCEASTNVFAISPVNSRLPIAFEKSELDQLLDDKGCRSKDRRPTGTKKAKKQENDNTLANIAAHAIIDDHRLKRVRKNSSMLGSAAGTMPMHSPFAMPQDGVMPMAIDQIPMHAPYTMHQGVQLPMPSVQHMSFDSTLGVGEPDMFEMPAINHTSFVYQSTAATNSLVASNISAYGAQQNLTSGQYSQAMQQHQRMRQGMQEMPPIQHTKSTQQSQLVQAGPLQHATMPQWTVNSCDSMSFTLDTSQTVQSQEGTRQEDENITVSIDDIWPPIQHYRQ